MTEIKKKYAVCMYGELRSINTVINNFYDNFINQLNADFYLMVQKTNEEEMDNTINMFEKNVIDKELYNKPENIRGLFNNYEKLIQYENYIIDPCLQIYYNFCKIFKKHGDNFEKNYDYIIITRSDYLHLFPFPDILQINNNKNIIWCYDGHEWGGINGTFLCIPSIFIKEFLSSFFIYLNDSENINRFNNISLNAEKFCKIVFDDKKYKIGKIQNNAFITADSVNTKTTWSTITYSDDYKVHYKYKQQFDNAFDALKQYNFNKKWVNININGIDYIVLE
jgi:hypothetical protein